MRGYLEVVPVCVESEREMRRRTNHVAVAINSSFSSLPYLDRIDLAIVQARFHAHSGLDDCTELTCHVEQLTVVANAHDVNRTVVGQR
jgi:hypothetical protein